MNPPPARLRSIFNAALDRPEGPGRDAFVAEACGDDEALRDRVRALLVAHDEAGRFLADTGPGGATAEDRSTSNDRDETLAAEDSGLTGDSGEIGPWRPSARPEIGTQIGPYRLARVIGEGGMGVVFLADQERPVRRRVALKLIKAGMDTAQVVARFEAERQALAIMDHPNIAKVFDAGATDSGRPFFVMEWVDGVPITQFCDEARLDTAQRLGLFIEVCRAIQHAHQKGIIHRDIKPSNVMVAPVDGVPTPKVIDFGVAKAIDQRLTERTLFTQLGAIVGTPEYMSPEQAGASPTDVDTRSDVYSLGVLLYELLTGSTPLDREGLRRAGFAEILRRIREDEPPRPSTRLSSSGERLAGLSAVRGVEPARLTRLVRGDLDWIVMKSLEKDRSRRYETAAGLARDIARYLDGDPVEASPPTARYRLGKFARKHRGAIATASAFALLLIASTVVSAALAIAATRARGEAERMSRFLLDIFEKPDPAVRGSTLKVSEYLDEARRQLDADRSLSVASRAVLRGTLDRASDATSPDLLVADLLDAAYRRLDADRSIPPLTKGTLLHALGKTFNGLARYDTSSEAFRKASDTRAGRLGPAHRDALASRAEIVTQDISHRERAIPEGLATVDFCERALGVDDPITIRARFNLAECLTRARPIEAVPLAERNLNLAEARFGPRDAEVYESRHGLAFAYGIVGRVREGLEQARRAFAEKEAALGPEHPRTLMAGHTLGWLLLENGALDECERRHRENLDLRRRKLGEDHVETLGSLYHLGWILYETGRVAEAEAMLADALTRANRAHGPGHYFTLDIRDRIAHIDMAEGRASRAVANAEETLRLRQEAGGDVSPTSSTASALAQARWWTGRRDEALDLFARFAESIEISRGPDGKPRGPDDPDALWHRITHAEFLFYEGRFDQALAEVARLGNRPLAIYGPDHSFSNFVLYVPAAIGGRRRPSPASVGRFREVVDAFARNTFPANRELRLRRILQADAAFDAGLFAEAEALWAEGLPRLPHDIAEVAAWGGLKSRLGSIYLDREEFARAEPLIVDGYRDLKAREDRLLPLFQDRPAEVARRVVRLYEEWGKPEKVAEWRKALE